MSRKIFNEEILQEWKRVDSDNWVALVQNIARLYFESGMEQMAQIEKGWSVKDFDTIKKSAHTLKSSCGYVGAEMAHDILDEIEMLAEQQDQENLAVLMQQLFTIFSESNSRLKSYLQTLHQAS